MCYLDLLAETLKQKSHSWPIPFSKRSSPASPEPPFFYVWLPEKGQGCSLGSDAAM